MGKEWKNDQSIKATDYFLVATAASGIYIIIATSILIAKNFIPYVDDMQDTTDELMSKIKFAGMATTLFVLPGIVMTFVGIRGVIKLSRWNDWDMMLLLMWVVISFSIIAMVVTLIEGPQSFAVAYTLTGYLTNMVLTHFYLRGRGEKPTIGRLLKWWGL